jgi:hypothetical protein
MPFALQAIRPTFLVNLDRLLLVQARWADVYPFCFMLAEAYSRPPEMRATRESAVLQSTHFGGWPVTDPLTRMPRIGDRVVALGHHGTFHVIAVHKEKLTVDQKLIGPADCYDRDIPWNVLLFRNSETPLLERG